MMAELITYLAASALEGSVYSFNTIPIFSTYPHLNWQSGNIQASSEPLALSNVGDNANNYYVVAGAFGGQIYVFDGNTGTIVSTFSIPNDTVFHLGYDYTFNTLLAVGFDDNPLGNFVVYGIDFFAGDIRWEVPVPTYTGKPVGYKGTAYFSSGSPLYAVDSMTGGLYWKAEFGGGFGFGNPYVRDNSLFIAGRGSLYALSTHDGSVIWSTAYVWNGFAADIWAGDQNAGDENIYASASTSVYAFNSATGATQWQTPVTNALTGPVSSNKLDIDNWNNDPNLYVADNPWNTIHALGMSTGQILWTSPPIGSSDQIVLAVNSFPYVFSGTIPDGVITAVDKSSGAIIATYQLDGPVMGLAITNIYP
jgi:outer membrane protein assembly factor BamB